MAGRPISLDFSGARLQELRERRGWTKQDLAKQCTEAGRSVSRSQVGKWESGEHKPDPRMLPVLTSVLEVEIDELLGTTQPAAK